MDDALTVTGDDRVTRWLSFDSSDRASTQSMIANAVKAAQVQPRTEHYLAISLPSEPHRVIGFARLALGGVKAAKLGYAAHADHQGHGYATDATRTLIDYGSTSSTCTGSPQRSTRTTPPRSPSSSASASHSKATYEITCSQTAASETACCTRSSPMNSPRRNRDHCPPDATDRRRPPERPGRARGTAKGPRHAGAPY